MPVRIKGLAAGTTPGAFAALLALYVGAFMLLAWPWLSGTVTIPWDAKSQFQPELQFLAASLARGESPFWSPNLYAGWPQIADPQSLIFSPLHLVLAALTPTPSFREADLVTFAYLLAGSAGVILLFRDRGWHPGGAVIAALVFAFGGSAASRLQHTGQIVSLAWLPLALWLLARTLDRASWPAAVGAGVFIGLMVIGRDQVALIGFYVVAGSVLAFWLDGPGRLAQFKATVLPIAASAATAIMLAAVPVALSALLATQSNRPSIDFASAGLGSLHPAHLLMLVVADLYGAADPAVVFWGPPSPIWSDTIGGGRLFLAQNMGRIYCGILPVILILGFGIVRGLLWAREIRFFFIAMVACLVYALGWYTPAFHAMYDLMPGVALFRRPADATFVLGLMIAINAGYVVHRLLSGTAPPAQRALAIEAALMAGVIVAAAATATAAGRLGVATVPLATATATTMAAIALVAVTQRLAPAHAMLAAVLLLAFTTGDLAWNNAPDESTGLPPATYDALRPASGDETVAIVERRLAATAAPDRRDRVELIGIAYHWPNMGLARGFDHLFAQNPLRLRDFEAATGVGDTVAVPEQRSFAPLYPSYRSALADLFGVRFILTGVPVERIDPALRPGDLDMIGRTRDAYVYENKRALPRVMFLRDYRVVDFAQLLATGWPAAVDPRRTLLLDRAPSRAPTATAGEATSGDAVAIDGTAIDGTARIASYRNTEVTVDVDCSTAGFVLLTDAWHPWWRAEVDGAPVPILAADVLFRAVEVAPGHHRIRFVFTPFRSAFEELVAKLVP